MGDRLGIPSVVGSTFIFSLHMDHYLSSWGSRISLTGAAKAKGAGANLLFWPISPKTAWNRNKLDSRAGYVSLVHPLLDPPIFRCWDAHPHPYLPHLRLRNFAFTTGNSSSGSKGCVLALRTDQFLKNSLDFSEMLPSYGKSSISH